MIKGLPSTRKGERTKATLSLVFDSFTVRQIAALSMHNHHHLLEVYSTQIFKHFHMLVKETSNKLGVSHTYGSLQIKRGWRCVITQIDIFASAFDCKTQHIPCIHETIKEIMWCYLNIYKYPQKIINAFATSKPTRYVHFQCLAVVTDALYGFQAWELIIYLVDS